jgi:hypothetical protein
VCYLFKEFARIVNSTNRPKAAANITALIKKGATEPARAKTLFICSLNNHERMILFIQKITALITKIDRGIIKSETEFSRNYLNVIEEELHNRELTQQRKYKKDWSVEEWLMPTHINPGLLSA